MRNSWNLNSAMLDADEKIRDVRIGTKKRTIKNRCGSKVEGFAMRLDLLRQPLYSALR